MDNKTGEEIYESKQMAIVYLKGQFTVDLLATVPFDAIAELFAGGGDTVYFKLLGVMKLVRVLRLSKIIAYLRSTEEVKAGLKLLKLVFFLMLYLHCFACAWYLLVKQQKKWIPPMNYNDSDFYILYKESLAYQYFVNLHAAVLLLTGNDVGPRDTF